MEDIRTQSLAEINVLGYRGNPNLPLLDDDMKLTRTEDDIANRINMLHLVYTTSIEGEKSVSFFYEMSKNNNWTHYLTPSELAYLKAGKQSKEQKANYSWNKEAIFALLWAVKLVKDLRDLKQMKMGDVYSLIPPEASEEKFRKSLKLRNEKDLLKELDFFYLLHWTLKHEPQPNKLLSFFTNKIPIEIDVVMERRRALEWLFSKEDWDDVAMDT